MWWTLEIDGGPRRVNHASVAIRERCVFSFGGYCTAEEYIKLDKMDIHIFDLNLLNNATRALRSSDRNLLLEPKSKTVTHGDRAFSVSAPKLWNSLPQEIRSFDMLERLQWMKLKTPHIDDDDYEDVPYMRYGHTATAIEDKVYIFGGRNDKYGACNSLFCFDTNTLRWSSPAVTGCIPPSRDGHSACVINKKIFIFGGYEQRSESFSKDVYVLDTTTMRWSHPRVTGEPASWRDFHTATAIGQNMYIFGGRGDMLGQYHSNQEIYDNQVVVFDTETYSWHWIITNGVSPIGRRSHSAIAYGRCIYIFGGYNGLEQKHYGDMYKFDTETRKWSKIEIHGVSPCPRRRHSSCLVDEKVVLFGGTSPAAGSIVEDDYSLRDHSDLFILDLNPSLKTLCKLAVIKYKLCQDFLPRGLIRELEAMVHKTRAQKPLLKSSSQG